MQRSGLPQREKATECDHSFHDRKKRCGFLMGQIDLAQARLVKLSLRP